MAEGDEFAGAEVSGDRDADDEFLCDLTWREAKAYGKGYADKDDAWKEALSNDWAKRLGKEFGAAWGKQPEIAAAAIARYSERMPEKLIEVWRDDGLIEDADSDADVDF